MLPSVISHEIKEGVEAFLETTFTPSNRFFDGILQRFFAREGALFKGPYLTLKLPFRKGTLPLDHFSGFNMPYTPYRHQERAFQRLGRAAPKSTIVATGTGSGKTECFLYPIIQHCYSRRGEPGIKAIFIYPMNALASDQAKRIAQLIFSGTKLKGNITAGIYVGGQEKGGGSSVMTSEALISNRDVLRKQPPDILLTNYKMLDYLLTRPGDFSLWRDNGPDTLQYIVVDELHTFDGAQGTDLACLIRRLKARLGIEAGKVCAVGTSATLGGESEAASLVDYAEKIFGESFGPEAIVREDTLTTSEFFRGALIERGGAIDPSHTQTLLYRDYETAEAYIRAQVRLWLDFELPAPISPESQVELGEKIKGHAFLRNLIEILEGRSLGMDYIEAAFAKILPEFSTATTDYREGLLMSFLALVSAARINDAGRIAPFLQVRYQLWLREMRRMTANLGPKPELRYFDDLSNREIKTHLPLVHCRDCGIMGWGSTMREHDEALGASLQKFYEAFFGQSPTLRFVFPEEDLRPGQMNFKVHACPDCLYIHRGETPGSCHKCGSRSGMIPILLHDPRRKNARKDRIYASLDCPHCGGHHTLTILGSRAASLTSVAISQLYASPFNADRKLLAFSDSVQDAAHRAGFFAARTYRFNLRTAIQKVVSTLSAPLSVLDFTNLFISFWEEESGSTEFLANFTPPDLYWMGDYEKFVETGKVPEDSPFADYVHKRLSWEILSEFGFTARIGRTLEKSGCCIAGPEAESVQSVVTQVRERLNEEIGWFREVSSGSFVQFILGVLQHVRVGGGIFHEGLRSYIQNNGSTWLINRVPYMPGFGRRGRAPAFIADHASPRFDVVSGQGNVLTWYEDWFERCFNKQGGLHTVSHAKEVYGILIEVLCSAEVFISIEGKSGRVFGINPGKLMVYPEVVQFRSSDGMDRIAVAGEFVNVWQGAPSLRFQSPAIFEERESVADYYGNLYRKGQLARIFSAEHTGLLEREVRQEIESSFIHQDNPTAPNLLSCTPTLEMGINIGDLSSIVLCSVPPSEASFLQRIGRAGRTDGNAFNLVVANGQPHDLFFFEEPDRMVNGEVEPPGVFLNAPAVLERQFIGFAFDRWIETSKGDVVIPPHLGPVLNQVKSGEKPDTFPYNLLRFVENHRTPMLKDFFSLFGEQLVTDSKQYLDEFASGKRSEEGSVGYRIIQSFNRLLKEREALRVRVQKLTAEIRKREKAKARDKDHEEELDEMNREKAALNGMIRAINEKDVFNFFTDEGLLPNYAFPEAGVLLRSIIYRKKAKPSNGSSYETKVFEYERASGAAIHELAPSNHFYAEGRKVQVDQIDLNLSEVEYWRFCPACSHAEVEASVESKDACPRCHSAMWSDAGQVRPMVRLRQVLATTSDKESRSYDDSDDRSPEFFTRAMLVDVDPNLIERAWRVSKAELPFGFEFAQKVSFRDINFGKPIQEGGNILIAGREVPQHGFRVCRACGRVDQDEEGPQHALDCRYRGKAKEDIQMDCLYLYREFKSEAIRILLPVTSFSVEEKVNSFVSALYLGLKLKFRGSTEHLQATVVDEPVHESTLRKKILVLYDRVPGGTGYLKELMQSPEAFFEILELAYNRIRECSCQKEEGRDGCYRCVYAYRISRDMASISRAVALEMLTPIIEAKSEVERIPSVASIGINALFDSELETRFIEALQRLTVWEQPTTLKKEVVNGKPGYFLRVNGLGYFIEPQVELSASQGVSIASKPDFVFFPERVQTGKPIAVFTDGFAFHADRENNRYRLADDLQKRLAIVRSGRYLTWSLTYDDVEARFTKEECKFEPLLPALKQNTRKLVETYDAEYGTKRLLATHSQDSFAAFIRYLGEPDEGRWRAFAFTQGLSVGKIIKTSEGEATDYLNKLEEDPDIDPGQEPLESGSEWLVVTQFQKFSGARTCLRMAAGIAVEDVQQSKFSRMRFAGRLFDEEVDPAKRFRPIWVGFLRLFNFMQFLPGSGFSNSEGLLRGVYTVPGAHNSSNAIISKSNTSVPWLEEIRPLTDQAVHSLLQEVAGRGLVEPEPGYELLGSDGAVAAEAELAWPALKVAVVPDSDISKLFKESGYRSFTFEEINTRASDVIELLS